jgi:hypothetical protein
LYNVSLRPLLVYHTHTYHHSRHRGNVTTLSGRPKLRSRLRFGHNQEGGPRSLYGHVVTLGKKIHINTDYPLSCNRDDHQIPSNRQTVCQTRRTRRISW